MEKVSAFLATGLEEVECLSVVDILRRAGVETELVSVTGERVVTGSHGIAVVTDRLINEADAASSDILFLPGGNPGTPNLERCEALREMLLAHAKAGKRLAAICAAPGILGRLGLLKGKRFTCFPGNQEGIDGKDGAVWTGEAVVTDGLITTGRGLGCGFDMGLELVRLLCGEQEAAEQKKRIQHTDTF